jgi:hypothetical protein
VYVLLDLVYQLLEFRHHHCSCSLPPQIVVSDIPPCKLPPNASAAFHSNPRQQPNFG